MTNTQMTDSLSGKELEEALVEVFSLGQGCAVLSKLPRRWHGHWLINASYKDAVFTKDEIADALDASKVDRGFIAWLQHILTGKRPTEGLRTKLGLRPLAA